MSYVYNLMQKTFKRRIGKNLGTLIAISLGVSLMVGVQITITSFATEALGLFVDAIGENDIIISGTFLPIQDYQSILDEIEANATFEPAAINIRVSQSVATYNLQSGILEKGVNFIGFELDEDSTFGDLYDMNRTKYNESDLENLLLNNNTYADPVLIGEALFDELELTIGQNVTVRVGTLDAFALKYDYITYNVTVVGKVLEEGKGKETGGWNLWTEINIMREIMGLNANQCTEINISLSPNHELYPITNEEAKEKEQELTDLLDAEDRGIVVLAFRALILETADEVLADVLLTFNIFGALIIFSGVLLLVNIQLIQVEDRIQQLGILRAIGSRRSEILRLILTESIILGFLGSLLGIGGGYGMSVFLVFQIGKIFFDGAVLLVPTVTAGSVIYSIAVGLILAVGAGIFPAIRAARVDVIEVIRGIKKVQRRRTGNFTLALGLALILGGISTFAIQSVLGDSYLSRDGWNTAIEQWIFMGAVGGILIGISVLSGYLFSRKIMGNGIGLSFILISVLMLLISLPELKDIRDNMKILITGVIVLALGTIIWVGVNLSSVTNFIRNLLFQTKLKKGVSLVASKYMTSKTMRSTLTFGIFALVLTMNIFASVYQSTYSYNTLDTVEFLSGGAAIAVTLDTPISNESLVNVERDLYQADSAITNVKGINSSLAIIQTDKEISDIDLPSDLLPTSIDLVYNDTFKSYDPPNYIGEFGYYGENEEDSYLPYSIFENETGFIFISEQGSNSIQVFSPEYEFLYQWGGTGSQDGEFNQISGMTLNSNDSFLYVVDSNNNRVQVFDQEGNFKFKFADFNEPTLIAANSSGYIYVLDKTDGSSVHVYNGEGEKQFQKQINTTTLAIARNGDVYLGTNEVSIYDYDLNFIKKFGSRKIQNSTHLFLDERTGIIFVTNNQNNDISLFDWSGKYMYNWDIANVNLFEKSTSLYIKENREIIIINQENHNIHVYEESQDYKFDFLIEQSIGDFNDKFKPAASEEYQREYSHEIWDLYYNRTKFDADGNIDNENGYLTVMATSLAFSPGDIFNLTDFFHFPVTVIVLGVVRQYPFNLGGGFPSFLITPDLYPSLSASFSIYPKQTRFLVSTDVEFTSGQNAQIANNIEQFFNGNDSILIKEGDFVAASADSIWKEMNEAIEFQIQTFDFMQYFVGFGLVVGAMGMIIIAVRNVSERRREIGMMRAIGYKKRQIIETIMLELFILAGLGLVMGIINSVILGWAYSRVYDWFLIIPFLRVLLYTGIMLGIALLSSIIPGIRSSQITPAEAIRYVG